MVFIHQEGLLAGVPLSVANTAENSIFEYRKLYREMCGLAEEVPLDVKVEFVAFWQTLERIEDAEYKVNRRHDQS
jgi:hypothetical protein